MARIVLTNDDGVDAPGLAALRRAAGKIGEPVIVAPVREHSGCSHGITGGSPIAYRRVSEDIYVVEGTPADCVRSALHFFHGQVGFVLSGINNGANLGVDVYHSGTVAAAREAAFHGVRGIAISHYRDRTLQESDWERAACWTAALLVELTDREWAPRTFLNFNLPCPGIGLEEMPSIVRCPLDPSPLPLSFREGEGTLLYNGRYAMRQRQAGHDVAVCLGGSLSYTEISLMEPSR